MKGLNPKLADTMLPIMPRTAQELRRLLDLKSTRNQQLQDVLLADPAAAIAVFRELERARPGSFEQIGDAAHAVSLIGIESFRRVLDSLPEIAHPPRGRGASVADAYSDAAHAAFYAAAISDCKGLPRLEELSTAALLQNPAILALWAFEPESALRATNAVRDGVSAEIAFGAELGTPLQDANWRLAEVWSLPRLARQAMGDWDDFNPRPQAVKLADDLALTTAADWHSEETETLTAVLSDFLDMSRDQACAWLHERASEAARTFSRFDYPLPGFQLVLMPGKVGGDEDDDDIPAFGVRRPHKQEPRPTTRPGLHDTMAAVMKRIREEAGAGRVVFAMLNKERSRLRTRLALGGQAEDGIRHLDLDLQQKHLFSALMGKPQSLWLNHDNAQRYQPYLPTSLRAMLGPQGAYMMSLFVGNRPLGLMYGDGSQLSETGYRHFRELCREATSALTAGSRAQVTGQP
jgi:HD-like signal output (HDOD) protein